MRGLAVASETSHSPASLLTLTPDHASIVGVPATLYRVCTGVPCSTLVLFVDTGWYELNRGRPVDRWVQPCERGPTPFGTDSKQLPRRPTISSSAVNNQLKVRVTDVPNATRDCCGIVVTRCAQDERELTTPAATLARPWAVLDRGVEHRVLAAQPVVSSVGLLPLSWSFWQSGSASSASKTLC